MVLAACSPLFRSILQRNPHDHPLLYFKGVKVIFTRNIQLLFSDVKLSNLQLVLDFMYNGEVNVAQEELNTFLNVAEELKVKGLSGNQSS